MLISAYDKTDRLREMRTRGREEVKNPENFAYVLNGSPLITLTPWEYIVNIQQDLPPSAPHTAARWINNAACVSGSVR